MKRTIALIADRSGSAISGVDCSQCIQIIYLEKPELHRFTLILPICVFSLCVLEWSHDIGMSALF